MIVRNLPILGRYSVRRQKGSFRTWPVFPCADRVFRLGELLAELRADEPGPHRRAMVVLGFSSLAASIGPFRWAGMRLVSTRWSKAFFTSWSASTFVFIAVGAVLDGGVRSSISCSGIADALRRSGLLCGDGLSGGRVRGADDAGRRDPDASSHWSTTTFLAVAPVKSRWRPRSTRDRLMGQLMDAASKDALTGCLSRGAFQELLEHEAKRARRHHSSFSLVVADVDDLKALNDSCAHHSGERTASAGRRLMRGGPGNRSGATSLGGDEFAMLLPDTDEDAVLRGGHPAERGAGGGDRIGLSHGSPGREDVVGGARRARPTAARGRRGALCGQAGRRQPRRDLGAVAAGGPDAPAAVGPPPPARRCEQPLPNSADCLERSQAGTVEVVDLLRPWGPRRAGAWCEWPAGAFRTSTRGAT